jgi:hypothetical protein
MLENKDFNDFVDYRTRTLDEQTKFWVRDQVDVLFTENDPIVSDFPANFMQANTWVSNAIRLARISANCERLIESLYDSPIDYAVIEADGTITVMVTNTQDEMTINISAKTVTPKDA